MLTLSKLKSQNYSQARSWKLCEIQIRTSLSFCVVTHDAKSVRTFIFNGLFYIHVGILNRRQLSIDMILKMAVFREQMNHSRLNVFRSRITLYAREAVKMNYNWITAQPSYKLHTVYDCAVCPIYSVINDCIFVKSSKPSLLMVRFISVQVESWEPLSSTKWSDTSVALNFAWTFQVTVPSPTPPPSTSIESPVRLYLHHAHQTV